MSGRSPQVSPPLSPGRAMVESARAAGRSGRRRRRRSRCPRGSAPARQAGDHRPVDDDRSVREGVAFLAARDRRVPARLAGPGIEPDDVRVDGVQDDQVLVDGEAAHLRRASPPLVHLAAVLPQEVAGAGVEGLDHVAGVRDIHDAVVHERRRLRHPGLEAPGPGEPELVHVAPVDLVEGAVAPAIEGAPPAQPVGGSGFCSIASVTGVTSGTCA